MLQVSASPKRYTQTKAAKPREIRKASRKPKPRQKKRQTLPTTPEMLDEALEQAETDLAANNVNANAAIIHYDDAWRAHFWSSDNSGVRENLDRRKVVNLGRLVLELERRRNALTSG